MNGPGEGVRGGDCGDTGDPGSDTADDGAADAERGPGDGGSVTAARVVPVLLVAGLCLLAVGAAVVAWTPGQSDADGDGLSDARERHLGTDPGAADTDGDRLRDGWEVRSRTPGGAALPGSDPTRKDLYVQVNYGARIDPLSPAERRELRRAFAGMDVPNPDGTRGVTLHLADAGPRGGPLPGPVTVDGSRGRTALVERFYTRDRMGPRACVYHLVVFGVVEDGETVGYGDTPGYFAVVDGTAAAAGDSRSPRVGFAVHELLHNVVGRLAGGGYHTDRGWLSGRATGEPGNASLSAATRRTLAGDGFADAPGYDGVCTDSATAP